MKTSTDKILEELQNLKDVSEELQYLAKAFSVTGNTELFNALYALATEVNSSSEGIQTAVSDQIRDQYEESTQSVANTIKACLNSDKV